MLLLAAPRIFDSQLNLGLALCCVLSRFPQMLEAADFYLNKVLIDAKKPGQEAMAKYATTFKAMMNALATFVQQNFATGLEWNPKVRSNSSKHAPRFFSVERDVCVSSLRNLFDFCVLTRLSAC